MPRRLLPYLAALTWSAVGTMLLARSVNWLLAASPTGASIAAVAGLLLASILFPRVFLKTARRNLDRLAERPERACLFSFFPWRGWSIALVMSVGGVLARHSPAPRLLLAMFYLGMGLCLLGGALAHLRGARSVARRGS